MRESRCEGVRNTQIWAALHSNWKNMGLVGASCLDWSEPGSGHETD